MLPPISIDTMSLSEEFSLTKEHVEDLKEAVVQTVTKVVHTSWREQAKRTLGSTRSQYLNSIIVSEEGRFANTITLVGELPNMIESGKSAFDMKKGFENSSKKKFTRRKDGSLGWYLTIPFTWAQPGAIAESQKFTGVLPADVAKVLKKKQKVNPEAALNLSDIPSEFKIPKTRPSISLLDGTAMIPEYKNKSSVFEGLTQVGGKGGPVMSFRRVSNNSDSNSWIHTGITARNLADKALKDAKIPEVVGDVIDSYLDNLMG